METVAEELRRVYREAVHENLQGELLEARLEVLLEQQAKRASLILSKYEVLTREYQNQNKTLKENHERIIQSE